MTNAYGVNKYVIQGTLLRARNEAIIPPFGNANNMSLAKFI